MQKLSLKGLTIAFGATWGLCTLFAGWFSMFGWCGKFVDVMSSIYIGYSQSFFGSIIGALWGFLDGAIGGLIIALIYNAVTKKNNF